MRLAGLLSCVGGGLAVAFGCTPSAAPRASLPLPVAPAPLSAECERADAERSVALQRLQAGQWFAALRRLRNADDACPEGAARSAAQAKLAEQKLAEGQGTEPWLLLERAHAARLVGKVDEARLLEDQAAYGLETRSGAELLPSVPVESDSRVEAFWSSDSEWLLERSGQGLSRRRRGDWFPRFHVAGFSDQSNDFAFATADLGALLVADSAWRADEDDETAKGYWITLVDVSASERFGKVRARFEIASSWQPRFSPDGRVFAFPEVTPDHRSRAARSYFSWASTQTGQLEHRVEAPGNGESVRRFQFDRQSRHVLVQWEAGLLSVVELASGRAIHQPGPGPEQTLHHDPFSPDGRFAIWPLPKQRGPGEFMLFDTAKGRGQRISAALCDPDQGLDFEPDSKRLVMMGKAGALCELELETGRVRRRRSPPEHPYTAPTYAFEVPLGAKVVPSPDGRFLALNDRYTTQLFGPGDSARLPASPLAHADLHVVPLGSARARVVNDARTWQWSPEGGRARLSSSGPTDGCADVRFFGPGQRFGWSDQAGQQQLVNCATGERSRPFDDHVSALALLDDARLVAADPDQHGRGLLWNLETHRKIGRFTFPESGIPRHYALTANDRYLAVENAIWDLERGELVATLPGWIRDVAAAGGRALLAERRGFISIHRAPNFALAGVLALASDGAAAIVFGYERGGRVAAIEVLGPQQAWDTTFACSVGAVGVPFRICREMLEQPGLLRALLE